MLSILITWFIIIIVLLSAARFIYVEVNTLRGYMQVLGEVRNLPTQYADGEIPFNSVSDPVLAWISEHLMYKVTDGVYHIEHNQLWFSKSPLSVMLPHYDGSKNKLAPAILTSLGIVGTFLGITLGLSHFNMSGESQVLLASAAELLAGMKTAFYTSLAGLGSSAVFMFVSKRINSKARAQQAEFIQHLYQQYFEVTAIHYLKSLSFDSQQEVVEAQKASSQAILSLGKDISQVLQNFSTITESFNGEALTEKLANAVSNSITHEIKPVLSGIQTELTNIKELKEDTQQALVESILNSIKSEMVQPIIETLSETSNQLRQSNEVSEKLNTNVANVVTSTSETLHTIDQFQKETMLKLQNFAQSLKEILEQFKGDTQGAMAQIALQVEKTLDSANQGLDHQRGAFEQSAITATQAFEGMKTSMEAALNDRQAAEQQLFNNVEARVASVLDGLTSSFSSQTSLLEKTGAEATTLMTSAREELQRGLGDIDTKVKSMSATVQQELEAFRVTYQHNLTDYFEQQNNLLETSLGKQRDGLNGVVENFKTVFEQEYQTRHNLLAELTAQYEKLEESARTIERVAKAIGLNEASKMAELQDAAQALSKEVGQLKREYSQASATFNDVVENLPKAMDQYFSRANQSFESFFKDFDQAASTIHNRLAQAASYLVTAQVQKRDFEKDRAEA